MTFWKRAAISSLLVAFLVAAPVAFIAPTSTDYSPGIAWHEVENLPHHQAIELIQSRAREVRGSESFLRNVRDPWFWQYFMATWLALAAVCFASCMLASYRRAAP